MTISIAICTYNGARFLPVQLESFARQTVLPDEVVLCDDCSTDETLQIAKNFARTAPFELRIVQNDQNLGYAKNFERAIRLCEGDLIALSDQDDLWYANKLAVLSSFFWDASLGGVFTNCDLVDTKLHPKGRTLWQEIFFTQKEQGLLQAGSATEILFRHNVVTGMTMMFRSALRHKLLPIPCSWAHDGWLAFMLIVHSRLMLHPESLVAYRTHQDQQIGPPQHYLQKLRSALDHGIISSFRRSHANNLMEYEKVASQFEDLAAYLQNGQVQVETSMLNHAIAKAAHARAAINALSRPRTLRWRDVLSHAKDYQRYSYAGLQHMFRDLIL